MMMGVGILFMALIGLIVIGVPLLIVVLIAGGGLTALFKSRPRQARADSPPSFHEPANERKCPACGRAVRADWNICPSCGAALT
jgi:hypothetical protein